MPKMSAIGSSAPLSRRARGFTLLELAVVVAIVGLMTALFPIALERTLPRRRVEAALVLAQQGLRDAQVISLVTGRDAIVSIHDREIVLPRPLRPIRLGTSTRLSVQTASGEPADALVFRSDGTTHGGRLLVRDGRFSGIVSVSALTGRTMGELRTEQ